jgi:sarcosine oxidase
MDLDAQVGVIGTGTMGSMTLWQLARRGVSAIGFEQFALGHDRGAGAGETRQYRAEYLEPEILPVMALATALYRRLEEDSGLPLLHITGGLTIGPPGSPLLSELISHIQAAGATPVVINHAEMRARYPQHRLADDDIVIWNDGSGLLRPEHAIIAAGTTAERLGARILPETEITRIEQRPDHVLLHAGEHQWRVRRAVVTAGPWTWNLLPDLVPGGDLGRLVLTWFPIRDDQAFSRDRFPTFTRVVEGITIYGMPALTSGTVRIGLVGPRARFASPGQLVRAATASELATIAGLVGRWMPDVIPSVIRTGIHLDAYTPDGQPLIGTLPGHEDVIIAAGFSGRGFKMAPVVGCVLAQLATEHRSPLDIGRWSPGRFRTESP